MDSSDKKTSIPSIPLMLLAILVMESMIELHTLWRNEPFVIIGLMIWTGFALVLRGDQLPHFAIALTLGAVIGEAAAYFMAVPWKLNSICMVRYLYGLPTTLFLRLMCVILAVWTYGAFWKTERAKPKEDASHTSDTLRFWNRATGVISILFSFFLIFPFGLLERHYTLGHKPRYHQLAEDKAKLQLGPDYQDYQYFLQDLDMVFRHGQSMTIKASFIAYNSELRDVQEVNVAWKEPWDGS